MCRKYKTLEKQLAHLLAKGLDEKMIVVVIAMAL
jgi:hypothetical protein